MRMLFILLTISFILSVIAVLVAGAATGLAIIGTSLLLMFPFTIASLLPTLMIESYLDHQNKES